MSDPSFLAPQSTDCSDPMRTKQRPMLIAIALLTATLVPPLNTASSTPDHPDLLVDIDEIVTVAETVVAENLTIRGVLQRTSPGPLLIMAENLTLTETGRILGYNGAQAASVYRSDAPADDGEAGGHILISATNLVVENGSAILAGSGGGGGSAFGHRSAQAGDGGRGGSIILEVTSLKVSGAILPGAGGDGGTSFTLFRNDVDDPRQRAGDGGDSGIVVLNKEAVRFDADPHEAPLSSSASPLQFSKEDRSTIDRVVEAVKAESETPAGSESGEPGTPGTTVITCSKAGTPGATRPTGSGGDGGHACSIAQGGDGGPGGKGKSRPASCTSGGSGGLGSSATAMMTNGGQGGHGLNRGGNGGNAESMANGGSGGQGGDGGVPWFGPACAGGTGGAAGSGTSGSATGGNGGHAICGVGGGAGDATSRATAGSAGGGGSGNPPGGPGMSGSASAGTQTAGTPGVGAGVCDGVGDPIDIPDIRDIGSPDPIPLPPLPGPLDLSSVKEIVYDLKAAMQ